MKIKAFGASTIFIPGTTNTSKNFPDKDLTVSEAKQFLPPRKGAYQLAINKDACWECKAPFRVKKPRSHSKTFHDWKDNRIALQEVLQ